MPVVIGILMLMGIVTKNAIMLVDFAVEEPCAHGVHRAGRRILDAGRKRARPIIMTTHCHGGRHGAERHLAWVTAASSARPWRSP